MKKFGDLSPREQQQLKDAHANGATIQFVFEYTTGNDWQTIAEPSWAGCYHYRIKPKEYKTWGEMSDEEQGALLLVHHRMEKIEVFNELSGLWFDVAPTWNSCRKYRVKPKPKVETHEFYNYIFGRHVRVWVDTEDNIPDWDTLRVTLDEE